MSHVQRSLVVLAFGVTALGLSSPSSASATPAMTPAAASVPTVGIPGAGSVRPASSRPVSAPALVAAPAVPRPAAPKPPRTPTAPATPGSPGISIGVDGTTTGRSQAVTIIVLLTVLSVAPSILLMMTSFTKIAIVLALVRQAIGTPTIPPNQVLAGIAMFLSLFVMGPVISQVNDAAIQPYLQNTISMEQAFERGKAPLQTFMLKQTGAEELQTMVTVSGQTQPANPKDVEFTTLVPAFVLSELKTAFIIGFVIFIPFLVIDLVVASILMSMGMMMLPPVMISMPFKILLFIMVDGWSLITKALVSSYLGTS